MADVHNAIKRYGALLRAFQDAFGLETEGGVERLGETLTPTFDLWAHPEYWYLADFRLYWASVAVSAVAAELSGAAILNPTDSGLIIVVERFDYQPQAASGANYQLAPAADIISRLITSQRAQGRDSRLPDGPTESVGLLMSGTTAGAAYGTAREKRSGSGLTTWMNSGNLLGPSRSLVLTPGWGAFMQLDTANIALSFVNAAWCERKAVKGELD